MPFPLIEVNVFDCIRLLQKVLRKSLSDIWEISARKREEQNTEQEKLLAFLLLLWNILYADH